METKPKKRLTPSETEEAKRRLKAGEDQALIAKDLEISEVHLNRLAKKWGLRKKDLRKERELIDEDKVKEHITKATTVKVQEKATVILDDILDVGDFCIDKFQRKSELLGLKLPDFLSKCVDFYEKHHETVEELREDLEAYEMVLNLVLREADPRILELQRKKDIREAVFSQILLNKGKVQEELLKAFLQN